ncbi:MAG: NAD(P)H-dependent oxidoreductase subunit E [Dehalococcoidia bacterium]|nr:NAD(P)H-dependent oxidoreductase subunit E [Dehalococcoidia bacterium]
MGKSADRMKEGFRGTREELKEAIAAQPQGTVTVLSSLLAVQDAVGYLPGEAIEEVASYTQTTVNDVWGVASFYTNFRVDPPCSHNVEVCWGATCHVLGAMKVVRAVLEAAGLESEGDVPGGNASVRLNTCLGACSQGPVISIDHGLYGKVSPGEAGRLVSKLFDA